MTAVYYFTRTGTSESLAKEIANRKKAEINKIEDGKNWKGVFGFIKAGFYASTKKTLPVTYKIPKSDEQIILVMPMWAGAFPPAVRKFIEEIGRGRITLIVSSGGSILKDREGFNKVIDVAGKTGTLGEL